MEELEKEFPSVSPRYKNEHEAKAQVAAFAAEHIEHYRDREHVFDNLGDIAAHGLRNVSRVSDGHVYQKSKDRKILKVSKDAKRTVATPQDYVRFLRAVGGARYEGIAGRAEMLKNYENFADIVKNLKTEIAKATTLKEHPNYLGSGLNSVVFTVEHAGKQYAVRIPKRKTVNPGVIDGHMAGAYLGKGIPHLEQVIAASYEDGVTVAEIMPGKEVGKLEIEELNSITPKQLSDLADTFIAANTRGIEIDPKPSNFFYDPEAGFGIVDYHSSKIQKNSQDQELGEVVGWGATIIANAGFYGRSSAAERTAQDYVRDLDYKKAQDEIIKRYKLVVAQKLQGEARQTALGAIDGSLRTLEETIQNYSNPAWVSKQLEQERQWRAQRAAKAATAEEDWATVQTV